MSDMDKIIAENVRLADTIKFLVDYIQDLENSAVMTAKINEGLNTVIASYEIMEARLTGAGVIYH